MLRNNQNVYKEVEGYCLNDVECHPSHKPKPTKSPYPTPSSTNVPPSQSPTSEPTVTATSTSSPTPTPSLTPSPSKKPYFPAFFNVSTLDGENGFKITGKFPGDLLGMSVANLGDVNGDGLPDIAVSAYRTGNNMGGEVCVIYGSKEVYPAVLNVDSLNGTNGFTITHYSQNITESSCSIGGWSSVHSAGDFDGDGFADIIMSCIGGDLAINSAFLLFGGRNIPSIINLSLLNITEGFRINARNVGDNFGNSVSGGHDINADGYDDVVITAPAPSSYGTIIFGNKRTFSPVVNASSLNGIIGFNAVNIGNSWSADLVKDINGDGISEIFIGNSIGSGSGAMIFGNKSGFPAVFDVLQLDGSNGFTAVGVGAHDITGFVSGGYDVNADGIDDAFITGSRANNMSGQGYVILGSDGGYPAVLHLGQLYGNNGFKINGISPFHQIAFVTGTKDLNGDRIDDIFVGSNLVYANQIVDLYVIYGKREGFSAEFNLSSLSQDDGFTIGTIIGEEFCCVLSPISGTPDIRGNCGGDLMIGDPYANNQTGAAYVIFGNGACTEIE